MCVCVCACVCFCDLKEIFTAKEKVESEEIFFFGRGVLSSGGTT